MPKRLLPPKGSAELADLVSAYRHPDADIRGLADRYGFTNPDALRNAMCRMGILRSVAYSPKPRYDDAPRLEGDVLGLFDLQFPFHDADFVNRCLDLAHAWGIRQGILGGDTLNQTAFSWFGHQPQDTWAEEAQTASDALLIMQQAVPGWLMLKGNHDAHLIKLLGEQIGMGDLLRLLGQPEGYTATDYYYCLANEVWRFSHPRNISVIHGRVPAFLCDKYEMNIIAGHGHLVGMVPSKSGRWLAIDSGICCDPIRLDYNAMRDNTRPVMNQGAVLLRRGHDGCYHPHLVSPLWTDWGAMKRMYRREV